MSEKNVLNFARIDVVISHMMFCHIPHDVDATTLFQITIKAFQNNIHLEQCQKQNA